MSFSNSKKRTHFLLNGRGIRSRYERKGRRAPLAGKEKYAYQAEGDPSSPGKVRTAILLWRGKTSHPSGELFSSSNDLPFFREVESLCRRGKRGGILLGGGKNISSRTSFYYSRKELTTTAGGKETPRKISLL